MRYATTKSHPAGGGNRGPASAPVPDVRARPAELIVLSVGCKQPNIFGLGDAGSMPNAKTMAAARKQAPIVALNALAVLDGNQPAADYDGYGSCPLTAPSPASFTSSGARMNFPLTDDLARSMIR